MRKRTEYGSPASRGGVTWARSQGRQALSCSNLDTRIGYFTSGETDAFTAVAAEPSLLAALEAGRPAPAGVPSGPVADEQYSELRPRGAVGTTDAASLARMSITGPVPAPDDDARALGRALAGPVPAKSAAGPMGEHTP